LQVSSTCLTLEKEAYRMAFLIGLGVGVVVGGLLVIVFGKNNKKHIEAVRSEVVETYEKAEEVVKKRGRKKAE